MKVADLIIEFSTRTRVPVDVNDVLAFVQQHGDIQEVYFWPSKIDNAHLRGALVHYERWEYPQGEGGPTVLCADIYYAEDMGSAEERVVTCKELLHILDPDWARVETPEQLTQLIERIVLPVDLQGVRKDGSRTDNDRATEVKAVAVLFPLAARTYFMEHSSEWRNEDIARRLDLPLRHVVLVMSPVWDEIYPLLTGSGQNGPI